MNDFEKKLRWPQVRVEEAAKVRAALISSLTGESLTRVISQAVLNLPLPEPKITIPSSAESQE